MAFSDGIFAKLGTHANYDAGFSWTYKEDATVAAISASGYLNTVVGDLQAGDLIIVRGSNGTALRQVTSATGVMPVTVAALTA